MSMSKKDFIALANVIREVNADASATPFTDYQIEKLSDLCEDQNPNFNYDRWIDYIAGKCGPSGGSIKGSAHAQTWTKKCGRCNGETEAGPDTQHYTCFFCGNEGRV